MNESEAGAMMETMARMQDAHNCQVHPEWRTQKYQYYRAVWVECAELLDHFGWKWWKHQQPDAEQVKLELVDIWHFGLSDLIRNNSLDAPVTRRLMQIDDTETADSEVFRLAVEELARQTLRDRCFAMEAFVAVLQSLPLPLPELFRLYVGKNVLNHFRQDHGYKTGEYRKLWSGREDNAHLVEALEDLHCAPEAIPEQLYQALERRYAAGA